MTSFARVPIAPIVLSLLSLHAAAQPAQRATGRVEGRVAAADGTPVPGAEVRITTSGPDVQPPVSYVEVTGEDGTFAAEGVAAGGYRVTAERTGYAAAGSQLVEVRPDGMPRIEITMVRLLSISGRVVDRDGDPVARARVQLLRPFDYRGNAPSTQATISFSTQATASADDLGQFRFANVAPDHYVLAALPVPLIPSRSSGLGSLTTVVVGPSAEEEHLSAYFPGGVQDPRDATTLRVEAPVQGLELRVPRGRRFTIRGSVVPPDGIDPPRISLSIRNGWGDLSFATLTGSGEFETERMVPGDYSITAYVRTNPGARSPSHYGHVDVTLAGGDVDGLRISMDGRAGVPITGRIRIEGVDDFEGYVRRTNALFRSPHEPNTLVLNATQDYPLAQAVVLQAADTDGVLHAADALPARYQLESRVYPLSSYVRRILVNGQEISNGQIDLTSGEPATIEVVYALDGGTLAFIRPADWTPLVPAQPPAEPTTWILLWPMRTETPMPRVVGRQMFSGGSFPPLEHLPPGDYYAALFDEHPPLGLSGSAALLRLLNDDASPVTIRSGATTTIEPRVISRERLRAALAVFPRDARD